MVNNILTPIIIGYCHYNTLGLIRSFGEQNLKPILVLICNNDADKRSYVTKSKYIDKLICVTEETLIEELNKIKISSQKGIIFPAGDTCASLVDQSFGLLSDKFILPSFKDKGGEFSKANNKELMRKNAEKYGFMTPPTWIVSKNNPIEKTDIIFPVIIKSIHSQDATKSTTVYSDSVSLKEDVEELLKYTPEVQIQTYIRKEKEIIFLGYSYGDEVCIPCVMEKIREYPSGFGCTGLGVISPDINKYFPIIKLVELIKSYSYKGLFSVEFLLYNNLPYFLEINFRNDGNGYFPGRGGVNLPVELIRRYEGKKISEDSTIKSQFLMMREYNDYKWMINNKYSFIKWIKDIRKVNVFQYWNKNDKQPFLYFLLAHSKNLIMRFFGNKK